jgi:alpha,alpha-trehalase
VFPDADKNIRLWRGGGLKTAVVSSSKNCRAIIEAAGMAKLFDVLVDGVEAARNELAGKPKPDTFLFAADKLGVSPARSAVIEDAVVGIQAGKSGGFGLVVGLSRKDIGHDLEAHGADVVVRSLDELTITGFQSGEGRAAAHPPSAIENFAEIARRLEGKRAAVFLDYDGTLTPIVPRPEDATIPPATQEAIRRLNRLTPVAVISGRDRPNVEAMVGLPELVYAGSHGYDIRGSDFCREHEGGTAALSDLDQAEQELKQRLGKLPGVEVERKRFAVAVHFRNARESDLPQIEAAVDTINRRNAKLRKRGGKKIFELQPDIEWHKGKALLWLLDVLEMSHAGVIPFYLGDDLTDEDAFQAIAECGIGILVGEVPHRTHAHYWLADPDEARQFLEQLIGLLEEHAL